MKTDQLRVDVKRLAPSLRQLIDHLAQHPGESLTLAASDVKRLARDVATLSNDALAATRVLERVKAIVDATLV